MIEGHLGSKDRTEGHQEDSTEGHLEDSVILMTILDLKVTMNVEVEEEIPMWTEEVAMIMVEVGVAMIMVEVGVAMIIVEVVGIAEDKEVEDKEFVY